MPPLAIMGGIAAAGSLGSGIMGANAAGHAADTQAAAAEKAAQLQYDMGQQALGFQKDVYNNQQSQMAPWLQTGTGALANLGYMMGIGGQGGAQQGSGPQLGGSRSTGGPVMGGQMSLGGKPGGVVRDSGTGGIYQMGQNGQYNHLSPKQWEGMHMDFNQVKQVPSISALQSPQQGYKPPSNLGSLVNKGNGGFGSLMQNFGEKFTAPTAATEQNDPGYQFRLQQGQQALERSAASKGTLLGGGQAKALQQYGQNFASNEYQNVYNRQLGEYQQRYNIYNQGQANQFNRLSALAGGGQVAAGQLGSQGNQAAGNVSNILLSSGQQVGNDMNNAAAARASGYVGGANAWGGTLQNLAGLASQTYGLSQGQAPGSSPYGSSNYPRPYYGIGS